MAKLSAREAALLRMALHDETSGLSKDMSNTSGEIGAQYPRMLFRKSDVEDRRVQTTYDDGRDKEVFIANRFSGLLCDIIVVDNADEAEALAEQGWDTSPEAAHGVSAGLVTATTAKDDEIAALRAQIEAMQAAATVEPKRGPGRPPRSDNETLALPS